MANTWTDIHVGDYGSVGRLTVTEDGTAVDISSFTTLQFVFRGPDGEQTTKTAAFDTNGVNGVLAYTIEDGLFDEAGAWAVRAKASKTGVSVSSDWIEFDVHP